MSQTQTLFKIDYHTDDDTGMYQVGEIDHGIYGTLEEYLKGFGARGKDELIKELGFMIYYIEDKFRELNPPEQGVFQSEN